MSWIPALLGAAQAGIGLYGSYRENKLEKRAQKRAEKIGPYASRPGEEKRFERFNPEQQQLYQMINSLLSGQGQQPQGGLLGDYGSEESFQQNVANPAIRNYEERIAPGIAERYAGLGAQSSSGFQNALASSGADLARQLGEFRGRQRQETTQDLLGRAFEPQYHTRYEPGGASGSAKALAGIGKSGFSGIQELLPEITKIIQEWARSRKKPGLSGVAGATLGEEL